MTMIKMSSKEILLAHINTLTEEMCAEIYLCLCGHEDYDRGYIYFNSDCVVVDADSIDIQQPFVKLRKVEYHKLLMTYGATHTMECMKILMIHQGKKKYLKEHNHYRQIVSWVQKAYRRINCSLLNKGGVIPPFSSIETKEQAITWIKHVPLKYIHTDPYVFYLRNKFNIDKIVLGEDNEHRDIPQDMQDV